jgi:hypothetical protein
MSNRAKNIRYIVWCIVKTEHYKACRLWKRSQVEIPWYATWIDDGVPPRKLSHYNLPRVRGLIQPLHELSGVFAWECKVACDTRTHKKNGIPQEIILWWICHVMETIWKRDDFGALSIFDDKNAKRIHRVMGNEQNVLLLIYKEYEDIMLKENVMYHKLKLPKKNR